MSRLYVIDCRKPDGTLDFTEPQPFDTFGASSKPDGSIEVDAMAKAIFRARPDVANDAMRGDNVETWPALIDPRWSARVKTW